MNRNILAPIVMASLLMLTGCDYNDKNFEGLEDATQPTNVIKMDYLLTAADYETIGGNIKTNKYFTDADPASKFLPGFFATKYFSADDGSSIRVTFNYKEPMSSLLTEYASVKYLKLTTADYKLAYGNAAYAPYLNVKSLGSLSKVLNENFKDAASGTAVYVDYKQGEGQLDNPVMWESFEGVAAGALKKLDGWFISSEGGTDWKVASYDDNQYVQYSANGTKGACVAWMVTPAVTVAADDYLSFDICAGYYNANCLSIKISEDFDGSDVSQATWADVTADFTIPKTPTSGYGTLSTAGKFSLAAYAGKKIYVAFNYVGDGANKKTTTYQIDNIMVGAGIPAISMSTPVYAVKVYDGKSWKDANAKVLVPTFQEYAEMGQNKRYFTSDVPAGNYLPAYIAQKVAYPQNGEVRIVTYRYFNGTALKIYSDEYIYSAETGRWALNTRIVEKTEQYVLSDGTWNFDPSSVVTLKPERGDKATATFYQTITDWVIANKGQEYAPIFNGISNNEYYYGSSAYNNNFDFRPASWKNQNAAAYGKMSDDELKKLMMDRLPEALSLGLEALYDFADVVEGIEVKYTVNFAIYDGTTTAPYTIQYKVIGKGKFEYIKDTLKKVG